MTAQAGSMLPRNHPIGAPVTIREGKQRGDPPCGDPLDPRYEIPAWLVEMPTPWSLACFLEECLQSVVVMGTPRQLVHGKRAELRPAKALLERYGVEIAARMIKYLADTYNCPFTLHHVIKEAPALVEQCPTILT